MQAIRVGAYQPDRDESGDVIRHKVKSIEYKGEGPTGVERTWIVIEPVAKAISILEKLTVTVRRRLNTDLLFILLQKQVSENPSLKDGILIYLEKFVIYVDTVLQPRLSELDIPPIALGDEMKRVTTRMFRRSVAWHIANQPFGVVAGMIQYGHMCETMFEGYAGSSESGFRAEVEVEREMARRADIIGMYEELEARHFPGRTYG